jgi:hypothetical protein
MPRNGEEAPMSTISKIAKMKSRALGLDVDDVLEVVGLMRKRPVVAIALPLLGAMLAGLAIGLGVGVLLMPQSARREVQAKVQDKVKGIRGRLEAERGDDIASPP